MNQEEPVQFIALANSKHIIYFSCGTKLVWKENWENILKHD